MLDSVTVDYITLTAQRGTPECTTIERLYDSLRFNDICHGHDEKPMRQLGYVGTTINGMFLGSRADGRILRASSVMAHAIADLLRIYQPTPRCTRIDAQVTTAAFFDDDAKARSLRDEVLAFQEASTQPNHPRVTLIQGHGRGDSLMVGSRSSQVYIRVYDKSREQSEEGPPWRWRYECEFKAETAVNVLQYITESAYAREAIGNVVLHYLSGRGIFLDETFTAEDYITSPQTRPKTDDERSLDWLRQNVGKVTRRLIRNGYLDDVLTALGISTEVHE